MGVGRGKLLVSYQIVSNNFLICIVSGVSEDVWETIVLVFGIMLFIVCGGAVILRWVCDFMHKFKSPSNTHQEGPEGIACTSESRIWSPGDLPPPPPYDAPSYDDVIISDLIAFGLQSELEPPPYCFGPPPGFDDIEADEQIVCTEPEPHDEGQGEEHDRDGTTDGHLIESCCNVSSDRGGGIEHINTDCNRGDQMIVESPDRLLKEETVVNGTTQQTCYNEASNGLVGVNQAECLPAVRLDENTSIDMQQTPSLLSSRIEEETVTSAVR